MSEIYQGQYISKEERDVLIDLERISGKIIPYIPKIEKTKKMGELLSKNIDARSLYPYYNSIKARVEWSQSTDRYLEKKKKKISFGFSVEDGHVVFLKLIALEKLPESIGNLQYLQKLILNCYNLYYLPRNIVNLKSLEVLDLTESPNLRMLPEDIGKLQSLEKLYLSGSWNYLPESISDLKNLKTLKLLALSFLKSLPTRIGNLTSLQTLKIRGNSNCSLSMRNVPITNIPEGIGNLKALRKLVLNGCKSLISIPEGIGELSSLEVLDLGEYDKDLLLLLKGRHPLRSSEEVRSIGRKADSLPENIGNLKSLQQINLSFWKSLKSLPKNLGNLKAVQVLNLSFCDSLASLPDIICNMNSLQELNLKGCISLKKLPENIGNLKQLRKLDLGGCISLSSLPAGVSRLKNLEFIDISHCNFKEVPPPLIQLNTFKSIDMSGNPLYEEDYPISMKINCKIIDTLPLTPDNIFKAYINKESTRAHTIKDLKKIFKSSKSVYVRTKCIEILDYIGITDDKFFTYLENLLLADDNTLVIIACINTLIHHFPNRILKLFKHIIENENSALVITTIYKNIYKLEKSIFEILEKLLLQRIALTFDVVIEEAKFFLDFLLIIIEEGIDNYGMQSDPNINDYAEGKCNRIKYIKYQYDGYHCWYAVKNNHVVAIDLSYLKEIPESISLLRELKFMRTHNSKN